MNRPILLAAAIGLTLPLAQLAAAQEPAPAAAPVQAAMTIAAQTVTATVAAVNHETREVTLTDEQGKQHNFIADDTVRNLGQVDVGDIVVIKYFQRMALSIYPVKEGAKGQVVETEVSRADLGQKPHGTVTQKIQLTGEISAIDPEARTVAIEGKYGAVVLQAGDGVDLSALKVGGTVRANYTETMSITVNSPETSGK